jgi:hypothetical protein
MKGGAMPTQELEATSCWTTQYWLRHCEGYRVLAGDEPIGYVEDVELGADDEPEALLIRVGEVFTHLLTISVEAIESFDPAGERLFVGSLADLGSDAFVRQLRIPAMR